MALNSTRSIYKAMLEKRLEKEIVRPEKELVIIEMYDYVVGLYFLIIISVQFIQDLDKQTRCSALGNRWEENESSRTVKTLSSVHSKDQRPSRLLGNFCFNSPIEK